MPTINVSSTSGVVRNSGTVYSTVRNAVTGSLAQVGGTRTIGQSQIATTYQINRAYMAFDTSGITITPASATLNINISLTDGFNYVVEDAGAPDLTTDIATTDYDAYIGSGFGIVFSPVNGWNTINFDAAALSLMNTNSIFKISIRSHNESLSIAPDLETQIDSLYFITNVPYISYTAGYTYSGKTDGLLQTVQSKINGILTSTILNVNGVPKLSLGQVYKGGFVAYILQSGDSGYDVNFQHGIIMSTDNLADAPWDTGTHTNITLSSGIGTGNSNTNAIVSAVGAGTYAAKLCSDLSLNGYTDWFLPNFAEFDICVGVLSGTGTYLPVLLPTGQYWTSTQSGIDPTNNGEYDWDNSLGGDSSKSTSFKVRPARYF